MNNENIVVCFNQSALSRRFALCLAVWLCLLVHSFWEVGHSSWERRGLRWNSLTTLILVSYFPFILTFNIAFSYSVEVLRTSDLYSPVWIFITSDLYKKGFQFLIHLSSLTPIFFQLIVNLDKQDDLFLVDFQGTSTVHNLRLENSVVSRQIISCFSKKKKNRSRNVLPAFHFPPMAIPFQASHVWVSSPL